MNSYTILLQQKDEQGEPLKLDALSVKKAMVVLRAINHKLRQQILKFIDEKGQATVTDIYSHLLLEQSVASQQLSILRKTGFVKTSRKGKFVYYSIHPRKVQQLQTALQALLH